MKNKGIYPQGHSEATHAYMDALILECLSKCPNGGNISDVMSYKTKFLRSRKGVTRFNVTLGVVRRWLVMLRERGFIENVGKDCNRVMIYKVINN